LGAVALNVHKPLSVDDMPGASRKEVRDAFFSPVEIVRKKPGTVQN